MNGRCRALLKKKRSTSKKNKKGGKRSNNKSKRSKGRKVNRITAARGRAQFNKKYIKNVCLTFTLEGRNGEDVEELSLYAKQLIRRMIEDPDTGFVGRLRYDFGIVMKNVAIQFTNENRIVVKGTLDVPLLRETWQDYIEILDEKSIYQLVTHFVAQDAGEYWINSNGQQLNIASVSVC